MRGNAKISKEKIIGAVLASSFEKSVGATSLTDISKRLGIKKASLYNHYTGRDDILRDTIGYCDACLSKVQFLPNNVALLAQKYSAAGILKAIVSRWFRLNESAPLLEINSFVESEKYFSDSVQEISERCRRRLVENSASLLKELSASRRVRELSAAECAGFGAIFASAIHEHLCDYISKKKKEIRLRPYTGEDSLFGPLKEGTVDFSYAQTLVEHFCALLNGAGHTNRTE